METEPLVPFGKYKGQPITTLLNDTKYLEWCKQQEWFKKFPIVYNICVNQTIVNHNGNSKTPEHNRIQNLFLEEENVKHLRGYKYFVDYEKQIYILQEGIKHNDFLEYFKEYDISKLDKHKTFVNVEFEGKFNWDIVIKIDCYEPAFTFRDEYNKLNRDKLLQHFLYIFPELKNNCNINMFNNQTKYAYYHSIGIKSTTFVEIKPLLGDDYPCVLRKMKQQITLTEQQRNKKGKYVLLVKDFATSTTTKEQLIQIFEQSNIKVVFLKDILSKDTMQIQECASDNISELKEIIKQLQNENDMLRETLKQYYTSTSQ
jgi:uncharacterized protein (DUF3820 family)